MPTIAVTDEALAKLAPKFAPKLVALDIPSVAASAFVTALPRVLATAVPVVFAILFETVLVRPFVNVSDAVLPSVFVALLVQLLVLVVPSAILDDDPQELLLLKDSDILPLTTPTLPFSVAVNPSPIVCDLVSPVVVVLLVASLPLVPSVLVVLSLVPSVCAELCESAVDVPSVVVLL